METSKLFGVKILINGKQKEKKFINISLSSTPLDVLHICNLGEHQNDAMIYFGRDERYEKRDMHSISLDMEFNQLCQSPSSGPMFLLIIINTSSSSQLEPTEINAFSKLQQAQSCTILPALNKYNVKGLNDLWNWMVEDFLGKSSARFKPSEAEEMESFMTKLHHILWYYLIGWL